MHARYQSRLALQQQGEVQRDLAAGFEHHDSATSDLHLSSSTSGNRSMRVARNGRGTVEALLCNAHIALNAERWWPIP